MYKIIASVDLHIKNTGLSWQEGYSILNIYSTHLTQQKTTVSLTPVSQEQESGNAQQNSFQWDHSFLIFWSLISIWSWSSWLINLGIGLLLISQCMNEQRCKCLFIKWMVRVSEHKIAECAVKNGLWYNGHKKAYLQVLFDSWHLCFQVI